jgi:hypothetical protein
LDDQPNCSSLDMSSEIDPKNVVMVTLEDILEEQCNAFETHHKDAEERRKASKEWRKADKALEL